MKNFDMLTMDYIAAVAKTTDIKKERYMCIDHIMKRYRKIIKVLCKELKKREAYASYRDENENEN